MSAQAIKHPLKNSRVLLMSKNIIRKWKFFIDRRRRLFEYKSTLKNANSIVPLNSHCPHCLTMRKSKYLHVLGTQCLEFLAKKNWTYNLLCRRSRKARRLLGIPILASQERGLHPRTWRWIALNPLIIRGMSHTTRTSPRPVRRRRCFVCEAAEAEQKIVLGFFFFNPQEA